MSALSRRGFLAAAGLGATFAIAENKASGRALGANDVVRVGVVGLNGRGQSHIELVSRTPGFRLAALCDVDPAVLGRSVERAQKNGKNVRVFKDVRDLIASKEIDAITIAMPNHWHALAAIWACQAGKDVYVEKPVSHNVFEGRQLVNAARKYGRMVQGGMQARSNPDLIEAVAWIRAGNLGKIKYVRGCCYKGRTPIGNTGTGKIPPGLDYDLWTGPAPLKSLRRQKFHYDWHWIYDYGNGDLGNQGVNEMQIVLWFLGYTSLSPRVVSVGGRLGYDDDGETPNSQLVYHAYDGAPLIFEVRGLPKSKQYQADPKKWLTNMDTIDGFGGERGVGLVVMCEGGKLIVIEGGETVAALDPAGKIIHRFHKDDPQFGRGWTKGERLHFRNWLEAIHTRDTAKLTAGILESHLSAALCHTGMISHRVGQKMPASRIRRELRSNRLLSERFEAFCEHLGRNGVDLEKTCATLGPWLAMDPKAERFLDNPAASALLTREYRKPFVVPAVE